MAASGVLGKQLLETSSMLGNGAQVGAAILRHQFDRAVSLDLKKQNSTDY